jgi:NADH-quinone oxidoreductase subunit A
MYFRSRVYIFNLFIDKMRLSEMNNAEVVLATNLLPLIIYFGAVLAVTGIMLGGAYFLGQRHNAKAADEPFESGIVPVGDVHIRFSVHFYLLAIFFVIFDMESVFLFAWSVALQESGWSGFFEALIFISVLIAALIYLWALGALDWRTRRQRIDSANSRL